MRLPFIALLATVLAFASPVHAATLHAPGFVFDDQFPFLLEHDQNIVRASIKINGELAYNETNLNTTSIQARLPGLPPGASRIYIELTDESGVRTGLDHIIFSTPLPDLLAAQFTAQEEQIAGIQNATEALQVAVAALQSTTDIESSTLASVQEAADAARQAAEAIHVPDDLARSADVQGLLSASSFQVWSQGHDQSTTSAREESGRRHDESITAVYALDRSQGLAAGLFVIVLATLLFALNRARHAVQGNLEDRVLLHAVATRLGIHEDSPEYTRALRECHATHQPRFKLPAFLKHPESPIPTKINDSEELPLPGAGPLAPEDPGSSPAALYDDAYLREADAILGEEDE